MNEVGVVLGVMLVQFQVVCDPMRAFEYRTLEACLLRHDVVTAHLLCQRRWHPVSIVELETAYCSVLPVLSAILHRFLARLDPLCLLQLVSFFFQLAESLLGLEQSALKQFQLLLWGR